MKTEKNFFLKSSKLILQENKEQSSEIYVEK